MEKFKIILPEFHETPENEENRRKRIIGDDFSGGGILAKVLAFLDLSEPTIATHLSDNLTVYFKEEIDRSAVNRALKKLIRENIIRKVEVGDVFLIPYNERTEMDKKIIEKFNIYIERIPKAFRNHYNYLNYYWVADDGRKYVKWACHLLGFKTEAENGK